MAPAAARTISSFLNDTGTSPEDYNLILTGDLGYTGSQLLYELLEKEHNIKLKGFLSLLEKVRNMAAYTPVHELILYVLKETGYGDYARALPGGEQRYANLSMLVEKAMDYEKTSYRGLFNFVRYIEQLQAYEVDYGEVNLAGAGNMVSLLIQSELGLDDFELAEDVKKYTLAKVESLFHIRHENGTVQFFDKPLDPSIFAKVVLVKENDELVPLDGVESLEKVKAVRMEAKKKVFVTNAIRSLSKVSPTGNPRDIQFVVMVGGSALDFEIPNFVTDALADYEIVAGRGNIRGCEGPRNAVATGLAMACVEQEN